MKVVVLNGWSASADIWREFLENLRETLSLGYAAEDDGRLPVDLENTEVTIELLNIDQALSIEEWHERLVSMLDSETVLIGWSLGGAIASYLIAERGLKPKAYVSLMSNPAFTRGRACNWAMPKIEFEEFQSKLSKEHGAALRVFRALLAQGESDGRLVLRSLADAYQNNPIEPSVLKQTLQVLGELVVEDLWRKLESPALFIWAEQDALSRCPDNYELTELRSTYPQFSFEVLPQASHLPMYSSADSVSNLVSNFIYGLGESRARI